MTEDNQTLNTPFDQFADGLIAEHGPLMSGEALWQTLGFRSAASFRQAKSRNLLTIHVFSVSNRRGTFAFTHDVADWLKALVKEVKM